MKNLLTATLPALALLALGGCATTGAVSSTEDDGIYYSSKDRTTVAAPAAGTQANGYGYETARVQTQSAQSAPTPATEDANPDYQGGTSITTTGSSDYYDDSYTSASPSAFGQPYTGPGVSSTNYTPTWSVSPSFYGSPFGYGAGLSLGYGYGGGFGGYSPFGYGGYGGFYDPFYSPFGFGYGSGLSIGFGYGFGGFGGFGYPYGGFGYPYGYGYSPYAYGYGGYGGDYYGGGYGGARRYVYNNALVNGGYPNGYDRGAVHVGRRDIRATNAVGSGVVSGAGNAPAGAGVVGGRNRMDGGAGVVGGNGGVVGTTPTTGGGGRGRGMNAVDMPTSATNANGQQNAMNNGGRGQRFDQSTMNPNSPGAGAAQGRRGGFFREMFANPTNGGGNASNGGGNASNGGSFNNNNQGGYSRPQRTYSQPDRSFSQPQRSFSQPSQSPSFGGSRGGGNFGGGGGGGGNFGGGGGGGGRRGR